MNYAACNLLAKKTTVSISNEQVSNSYEVLLSNENISFFWGLDFEWERVNKLWGLDFEWEYLYFLGSRFRMRIFRFSEVQISNDKIPYTCTHIRVCMCICMRLCVHCGEILYVYSHQDSAAPFPVRRKGISYLDNILMHLGVPLELPRFCEVRTPQGEVNLTNKWDGVLIHQCYVSKLNRKAVFIVSSPKRIAMEATSHAWPHTSILEGGISRFMFPSSMNVASLQTVFCEAEVVENGAGICMSLWSYVCVWVRVSLYVPPPRNGRGMKHVCSHLPCCGPPEVEKERLARFPLGNFLCIAGFDEGTENYESGSQKKTQAEKALVQKLSWIRVVRIIDMIQASINIDQTFFRVAPTLPHLKIIRGTRERSSTPDPLKHSLRTSGFLFRIQLFVSTML